MLLIRSGYGEYPLTDHGSLLQNIFSSFYRALLQKRLDNFKEVTIEATPYLSGLPKTFPAPLAEVNS